MTERLYYTDPKLLEFEALFVEFVTDEEHGRSGLVLDRTAFYPTSGGQTFDTGWLLPNGSDIKLRVIEVAEAEDGSIVHYLETPREQFVSLALKRDVHLHGIVDAPRRRDHMQQHTGQHLLSAVFIELFYAPTVSFHMGDESCTIDLDTKALSPEQVREAERRSNQIITDDVPVEIKFATLEEARAMGVRKIPPELKDTLRLIEIKGHDLTACGGTHVSRTGEIGAILIRKTEKVKQGMRVEFVCGVRAVATARKDFETLTAAAALFSSHIYDVPEQIRKALDEAKAAGKRELKTQAELAELMAARMLAEASETNGVRVVKRVFADRDLGFIKLLAQKLTTPSRAKPARAGEPLAAHPNVVALLAGTVAQPALVFAQSAGGKHDMGALMKEAMQALGGRGGGTRDMAQAGVAAGSSVENVLDSIAAKL